MSGKLLAVSLELSEYRNNTPGKHERLNPEPSTHPMDLEVITRAGPAALLPKRRPAILLSGLWPDADRSGVVELDEVLDGRYAWIDGEAERLAEVAARQPPGLPPPPAWVHALGLRYYLLRLLRIVVYFTAVRPLGSDDRLRLLAGRDDEDKARLVTLLCQRAGATCRVAWREEAETPIEQLGGEGKWRGLLRAWAAGWHLRPRMNSVRRGSSSAAIRGFSIPSAERSTPGVPAMVALRPAGDQTVSAMAMARRWAIDMRWGVRLGSGNRRSAVAGTCVRRDRPAAPGCRLAG